MILKTIRVKKIVTVLLNLFSDNFRNFPSKPKRLLKLESYNYT